VGSGVFGESSGKVFCGVNKRFRWGDGGGVKRGVRRLCLLLSGIKGMATGLVVAAVP